MKPSKLSDHFKKDQSSTTRLELSFKDISILDSLPFRASSLVHLDLSFNSLSSLEGIDQFPSLTFLNISNNLIKSLLTLSNIKRKELLTNLQIRGNPASRHPNLIPILLNYFPNIREVDAELLPNTISKDIMQAMELSSSLIPYLYINEQLILKIHRDIQFLNIKFELFEALWPKLPISVLPNKNEVRGIHSRFVHKYPEIIVKNIDGKVRPAHILEFMQQIKEQININSAHLEEEIVCKIYRWLYCEIVLQLHSLGNVDLQCFLQTYDEPSINSSYSVEGKVDGITSDLMKFSQLSHYPQSLLHFPVFGCNVDYMKALHRVLVKQIGVVQSLIKERKMILMKDLKEICDEVQSPPSKMSYPTIHSYEYCSPSVLRDFVSPTNKSPTEVGGFLSPKFRLESGQGMVLNQFEGNKQELVMRLDFEDESELNITNSYDELSQTIEELLREDEKDEERARNRYLRKILKKSFLTLKKKFFYRQIIKIKQQQRTKKIFQHFKSLNQVCQNSLSLCSKLISKRSRRTLHRCFKTLKTYIPTQKSFEISIFFHNRHLKIKAFQALHSLLHQKSQKLFSSCKHRRSTLLSKSFSCFKYFLKVTVTKKRKIRQYKLKTMKTLIKKILKSWLYLVRPSAKFIKKRPINSNSQVDKLLIKLQQKEKEIKQTFKKLKKPSLKT